MSDTYVAPMSGVRGACLTCEKERERERERGIHKEKYREKEGERARESMRAREIKKEGESQSQRERERERESEREREKERHSERDCGKDPSSEPHMFLKCDAVCVAPTIGLASLGFRSCVCINVMLHHTATKHCCIALGSGNVAVRCSNVSV